MANHGMETRMRKSTSRPHGRRSSDSDVSDMTLGPPLLQPDPVRPLPLFARFYTEEPKCYYPKVGNAERPEPGLRAEDNVDAGSGGWTALGEAAEEWWILCKARESKRCLELRNKSCSFWRQAKELSQFEEATLVAPVVQHDTALPSDKSTANGVRSDNKQCHGRGLAVNTDQACDPSPKSREANGCSEARKKVSDVSGRDTEFKMIGDEIQVTSIPRCDQTFSSDHNTTDGPYDDDKRYRGRSFTVNVNGDRDPSPKSRRWSTGRSCGFLEPRHQNRVRDEGMKQLRIDHQIIQQLGIYAPPDHAGSEGMKESGLRGGGGGPENEFSLQGPEDVLEDHRRGIADFLWGLPRVNTASSSELEYASQNLLEAVIASEHQKYQTDEVNEASSSIPFAELGHAETRRAPQPNHSDDDNSCAASMGSGRRASLLSSPSAFSSTSLKSLDVLSSSGDGAIRQDELGQHGKSNNTPGRSSRQMWIDSETCPGQRGRNMKGERKRKGNRSLRSFNRRLSITEEDRRFSGWSQSRPIFSG